MNTPSPIARHRAAHRQLGGLLAPLAWMLAVLVVAPPPAAAKKKDEVVDEIDYLALAARLLRDDHPDRAEGALGQVDQKDPNLDRRRYHTLAGLAALAQKNFKGAARSFDAAIKAPPPPDEIEAAKQGGPPPSGPDPSLYLYLAKSYFGLEAWDKVIRTLDRAGNKLDDDKSVYLMRAQANWTLKHPGKAIAALRAGQKRFPKESEFTRTEVFYLVELGLFQEATDVGQRYLARAEATAEDYIAVAEALRQGKQPGKAGMLLEGAHLRYPTNEKVMLALSHTYLDRSQPLAAAMLLEDASRIDPKFAVEAAELYKEAGRHTRAMSLNARVADQKAKFRQRLAILIQMEHFELVGGMASTLDRLGLLKDDQVRYALAYALYKVGDFDGAERHLKRLTEPKLLESGNQLRKAMAACRETGWQCI